MSGYFINFTNHPASDWEEGQKREAEKYGEIRDLPFPAVDPRGDENYVTELVEHYVEEILRLQPSAVLCQGEFCLVYQVVKRLQEKEILVLAACSERIIKIEKQRKEAVFVFRRFRRYGE